MKNGVKLGASFRRRQDRIEVFGDGTFRCSRADGAKHVADSYSTACRWLLGTDRELSKADRLEAAIVDLVGALEGHADRDKALLSAAAAVGR